MRTQVAPGNKNFLENAEFVHNYVKSGVLIDVPLRDANVLEYITNIRKPNEYRYSTTTFHRVFESRGKSLTTKTLIENLPEILRKNSSKILWYTQDSIILCAPNYKKIDKKFCQHKIYYHPGLDPDEAYLFHGCILSFGEDKGKNSVLCLVKEMTFRL